MNAGQNFEFLVAEEDAGERLDRFLVHRFSEISRTRIQQLIEEGRVHISDISPRASHRVAAGETVVVEIPPAVPVGVVPEEIPLEVLYEDDDLAIVNKPAGMIVHPGAGDSSGTLAGALLHRFGQLSSVGGPLRPGIVHRLDKGTSGVLVVARNDAIHHALAREFRARRVEKTYIALVHGGVKKDMGRIELPVARDLRHRTRMTTRRREGRAARTDCRVKLRLAGFTLVEARLHTGRTHQIRVHLSSLGHPVAGDPLYGAPRQPRAGGLPLPLLGRLFLHASHIRLIHPRTGQTIEARAPLPAELSDYFRQVAKAAGATRQEIDDALAEFL